MNELQAALGYPLLQSVVLEGYRRPSLSRADEMRKLLITVLTNKEFEKLIRHNSRRQTKDQYKAQLATTTATLSPIGERLVRRFEKASRVTGIDKRIQYADSEQETNKVLALIETFYGQTSVEDYFTQYLDSYSLIDANAFLAIHFKPFDAGEQPQCYPFVWPCTSVVDYAYNELGILSHVLTKETLSVTTFAYTSKQKVVSVTDYFLYETGVQTVFMEVVEGRELTPGYREITLQAAKKDKPRSVTYAIYEYATNTEELPIMAIGYKRDLLEPSLFVSPLYAAQPHFVDFINKKSKLDSTTDVHVLARLFQYTEKCPGQNGHACQNGKVFGTENECPKCKGKGFVTHDNEQDVIYLPMPDSGKDLVPLDKLGYYLTPDIKVVELLERQLNELEYHKIPITVFGTDMLQKTDGSKAIANTATEVNLNADEISDTLRPFVAARSARYKFVVRQIALFNDLGVGLEIFYEYPADLAIETLGELLLQLEQASKSDANSHVTDLLSDKVSRTILREQPENLKRYEVQRRFQPFNGKTPEERTFLLGSSYVPNKLKILYANFDSILDELTEELRTAGKDFYMMPYNEQNKLIDLKVDAYRQQTEQDNPAPSFSVPPLNTPTNGPTGTSTFA